MAWAEVASSKAATLDAASAGTVAATMGASVPDGALMWAVVMYSGGAAGHITGLAGGGATWTMVGSEVQLVGPDDWLSIWKGVSSGGAAAHAITASFDTSRSDRGIYVGAWTGNEAAGATDGSGGEVDASTTNPSVTIATSVDGNLLMGATINNYPEAASEGSGFDTATNSGGFRPISVEFKVQATASGATVVDFNTANTGTHVILAAAFKAAAGGGSPALDDSDGFMLTTIQMPLTAVRLY